ncbi:quinone-modifying oxidoreductase, subunit QmoC [Gammaproteobacteria bacterium]
MSEANHAAAGKYRGNFLKEVEANVEEGEWVKMCMQCGVCSGSCPMGPYWEHPPQEIFMMIRAGKREEVLSSTSMWMCTSCYNCLVRCPREVPVTHVMHGLATYAQRLGMAPQNPITARFAQKFWDNLTKTGRVNELKLGMALYFINGLSEGIQTAMKMQDIGLGMFKTKRMDPLEILGGHGVKDRVGFHAMLKKAQEIEMAKLTKVG